MKTLFESRYESNKALAKEIYRYLYFRRPLILAGDIFLGLIFLVNIWHWIMEGSCQYIVLTYLPVFLLLQFYMYRKTVGTLTKRNREAGGGNPIEVTTCVTENTVKTRVTAGAKQEVELSKFTKAVQTRNLILLLAKGGMYCAFRKDSFTQGTPEEFLSFLRSKGIK